MKKIMVGLCTFLCTSALIAMESQQLIKSIAQVAQEIDEVKRLKDTSTFLSNNYYDRDATIQRLHGQYEALVEEKQKEQSIVFPESKDGYHVGTLSLKSQGIQTILFEMPSRIPGKHITVLDISHNNLEDLPLVSLSTECPNLTSLNASHNAIEYVSVYNGLDKCSRPASIGNALTHLDLHHNKMKTFDVGHIFFAYPNLKHLDVSENSLEEAVWSFPTYWQASFLTNELPTIDMKKTNMSSAKKELIEKSFNDCAGCQIRRDVDLDVFEKIMLARVISVGATAPWAFSILPITASVPIVLGSGLVVGRVTNYACTKYGFAQKKAVLEAVAQNVRQHLLFDEIETDYESMPMSDSDTY